VDLGGRSKSTTCRGNRGGHLGTTDSRSNRWR
jgi:hypothetical protein